MSRILQSLKRKNGRGKMKIVFSIAMFSFLLLLSGCGATGSMSELRQELKEIKERSPRGIKQLRVYEEVKPFLYSGQLYRSPFEEPVKEAQIIAAPILRSNGVKPPAGHNRSELEGYSVDALSMLGVIGMSGRLEALIKTPDGKLHRVSQGMYIGENYGRVVSVTSDGVSIIEIKPDGANSWMEAPRVIKSKTSKDDESSESQSRV